MPASVQALDNAVLIRLEGDVESWGPEEYENTLLSASEEAHTQHILLDLSELSHITSFGVAAIGYHQKTVEEKGGSIILINPRPPVQKAFHLAGLMQFLSHADSVDAALKQIELSD